MPQKVKAIPDGFHTITPHLTVKNGAQAIEFYKKAFGAEVLRAVNGPDGSLMHADLRIGDSMLMLNDEFPAWQVVGPQTLGGTPVTVHVYVQDADAAFKRAIDAGCTVKMPLMDQMWGDRYGQLVDPFGHQWSIATHIEDPTPEEIQKRMANMPKM
ncbi:VOC family protein [bacterium]|nr:VOC family protein [bacterium]